MSESKKSLLQVLGLTALFILIGVPLGIFIADNFEKISPVIIFLVVLVVVVFIGVGNGVAALAKVVKLDVNKAYCYLPIFQDIVIFHVVKGIKPITFAHSALKKFNMLIVSTVSLVIAISLGATTPLLFSKIVESSSSPDSAVALIASINVVTTTLISILLIVFYILRVLYFDVIFKLVYKNPIMRVLNLIPICHVIFIATLQNHLGYLQKTVANNPKKKA